MVRQLKGERSVRLLRVGETVRHALSEILARDIVQDEDLEGLSLTVSEVQVSPDLRNATVFFLPLGGELREEVADALNKHTGFIRGQLSKNLTLKYMPKLKFELDRSFDEASRITALLEDEKIKRDLKAPKDNDDDNDNGKD